MDFVHEQRWRGGETGESARGRWHQVPPQPWSAIANCSPSTNRINARAKLTCTVLYTRCCSVLPLGWLGGGEWRRHDAHGMVPTHESKNNPLGRAVGLDWTRGVWGSRNKRRSSGQARSGQVRLSPWTWWGWSSDCRRAARWMDGWLDALEGWWMGKGSSLCCCLSARLSVG